VIYLCAGIFAEGPSDYRFLSGLLDRLLEDIGVELKGGHFDSAQPVGIDAPAGARSKGRDERIAAAIDASWEECTLFVVHGDGALSDPLVCFLHREFSGSSPVCRA
jgi:hypothetical protein